MWKRKNGHTPDALSDNETFILFVQEAKRDVVFRQELVVILAQNAFQRSSRLNTAIEHARLQGRPFAFIAALEGLKDDAIAARLQQLLADG